ncbi:MAG TPA: TonB-dependent receptor [Chitinophagales bacterium]|nr:TonB-dependent receptor [Chitinophagales bacterium]
MKSKSFSLITLFVLFQIELANTIFADTIPISIPEVMIQSSRENFYSTSNYNYKIDSFQTHYYGQNSIADILQNFTPTQINSYGFGGAVTLSLRGTADDQTSVFWNGLRINSLTLGTIDISLIPINAANSIQIVTNASSAVLGSGNFGGAVLLNNNPIFKKKIDIGIRQDFSSFKNYRTNFSLKVGNEKVQFSSSSFYQTAKNNFPFFDKYKFNNPTVLNENNETNQWATINELNLKLKKNQQLDIGNFTLYKHHNIPANMGSFQVSKKYQNDFTTKVFVKYQMLFKHSQFYFRSGYIYDYMLYNDSINKINAPYFIHQSQNSANYRHFFKYQIVLDVGIDYNAEIAKVEEYKSNILRHRGAAFFGVKYSIKNFVLNATMRQEMLKAKYIRPQFGINISYTDNKNIFSSMLSYADKFRLPDFNDLYWQPGGNLNLKPENGFTVEYSFALQPIKKTSKYQLTFSNSIYYSIINNNIVWSPIVSGLYSPQNIKKTRHYGFESKLENIISFNKTNFLKFSINYNYNHSSIIKDETNEDLNGNFIRYKPQHTLKSYVIFEDKYFNLGLNYLYIGQRFTDDENIKVFQLKPYSLIDLFIAYKGNFKNVHAEFGFKINNLLNTQYESLRSYAQPLRNYNLTIILTYKSILK